MNPPPGLQKFLKDSNVSVSVSSTSTTSQNNLLANEIENMMRKQQQQPRSTNFDSFPSLNSATEQELGNFVYISEKVSPLKPGMYNIVINSTFGQEARVNIVNVLKRPLLDRSMMGGFFIDIQQISGTNGRFKTMYTHSKQYGAQGDINVEFVSAVFSGTISDGQEQKGINFVLYKNGKCKFSGGFIGTQDIGRQPELVRKYIIDNFTSREPFLYTPLEYNNLSGQFKLESSVNLSKIAQDEQKIPATVRYEPELSPILYTVYEGYSYNLSKAGTVQIVGVKSADDLLAAYQKGIELVSRLYALGDISHVKNASPTIAKVRVPKRVVNAPLPVVRPDDKKCSRMTKAALVDFAKKLGVVGIKPTDTKSKICMMISKVARNKAINAGNKSYNLYRKGEHFMVGKKRCLTYKKENLQKIATKGGVAVNNKNTVKKICNKLEKPSSAKTPKKVSSPQLLSDITKLLGKKMKPLNDNVKRMRNELDRRLVNAPKNNTGAPKKAFVKAAQKNIVNRWKSDRKLTSSPKILKNMTKLMGKKMKPIEGNVKRMKNEIKKRAGNVPLTKSLIDATQRNVVAQMKKERVNKAKKRS